MKRTGTYTNGVICLSDTSGLREGQQVDVTFEVSDERAEWEADRRRLDVWDMLVTLLEWKREGRPLSPDSERLLKDHPELAADAGRFLDDRRRGRQQADPPERQAAGS